MNQILIEYRSGVFFGFWLKLHESRLIFIAGGRYGDTYDFGLRQAERRANKFREKHHEINKVVFKKLTIEK